MDAVEVNFDGLVGLTHNYSGLSYGNIASIQNQSKGSNPKAAALQGLKKMKFLADRGIRQAVLPPHPRPYLPLLRELGFEGNDQQMLAKAYLFSPELIFSIASSAHMWTANAATVSPSADTLDGKMHLTPANLSSKFHRSIEASFTEKLFNLIFNNRRLFTVHPPLPQGMVFADEGAANHNRFCRRYFEPGLELFVWGRSSLKEHSVAPKKFPARQTYEASKMIAQRHMLNSNRVLFAQQNPAVIDVGVFHNDVISVANEYVYLFHEEAFVDTSSVIAELKKQMNDLVLISLSNERLSVEEAVSSYLFNSQIVTLPNQQMLLLAPSECFENERVRHCIQDIVQDSSNPISEVHFFNLSQSMTNGGGPACLRLRVVLTEEELKAIPQSIFLTDELYDKLTVWIEKHYRDSFHPQDLIDIKLLEEIEYALEELVSILQLKFL